MNRDILFIGVDGGNRSFNNVTLSGTGYLANGTAASPSLAFDSDRNTGIFRVNADVLGISAGGVDSAWFSSTAWLGLSTLTGGVQLYNTTDMTNYERLAMFWNGSVGYVGINSTGTGTTRTLKIGVGVLGSTTPTTRNIAIQNSAYPFINIDAATTAPLTGVTGGNWVQVTGTAQQTAGTNAVFAITPTYNQASGNAANTDLLINRTQTAIGSGAQLFLDCQATGTSQFAIGNTGILHACKTTGVTAGGSANLRLLFGSSLFGIYAGSGLPTVSAALGSVYLRSDGSSATTRAYINTDGGTTWTNFVTTL